MHHVYFVVYLRHSDMDTSHTFVLSVHTGMVPALFPDDEKESVLNQIRDEALKMGSGPSKDSVWQYFVKKSANNLHIVLGMSPVGDVLRARCRNFPGNKGGGVQHGEAILQKMLHVVMNIIYYKCALLFVFF